MRIASERDLVEPTGVHSRREEEGREEGDHRRGGPSLSLFIRAPDASRKKKKESRRFLSSGKRKRDRTMMEVTRLASRRFRK